MKKRIHTKPSWLLGVLLFLYLILVVIPWLMTKHTGGFLGAGTVAKVALAVWAVPMLWTIFQAQRKLTCYWIEYGEGKITVSQFCKGANKKDKNNRNRQTDEILMSEVAGYRHADTENLVIYYKDGQQYSISCKDYLKKDINDLRAYLDSQNEGEG